MKNELYKNLALHVASRKNRFPLLKVRNDLQRSILNEWISLSVSGGTGVDEVTPPVVMTADPVNLNELNEMIMNCSRCAGAEDKKCGVGSGTNGIMIILNAPAMVSSFEKKQFKAESVDLLKKMLAAIDVEFYKCYITSIIKCEPSETMHRPSSMFRECQHILKKEIELVKPLLVMVFGEIVPLQKIIHESEGISWYNIEHPITLIKNPDLKGKAWKTLKLVSAEMNSV